MMPLANMLILYINMVRKGKGNNLPTLMPLRLFDETQGQRARVLKYGITGSGRSTECVERALEGEGKMITDEGETKTR